MRSLNGSVFSDFHRKSEPWIFLLGTILCLIPVWGTTWFASQDGPSHLHNSKVLLDFWQGNNVDFYRCCYELDSSLFPNWTNHFVFANLMRFFSPWLTEKIWLTAYVLVFSIGFRLLFMELNPKNGFLSLLVLPFMFSKPLYMGFYNFTFGIAELPCFLFLLIRIGNKKILVQFFLLSIFLLLIYFTHLIGLFISLATAFTFLTANSIAEFTIKKNRTFFSSSFVRTGIVLLAASLPVFLLTYYFLIGGEKRIPETPQPINDLLANAINLETLVIFTSREFLWAKTLCFLLLALFAFSLLYRIRKKQFQPADAFFLIATLLIVIYLFQPGPVSGHGILPARIAGLPWIFLILWLVSVEFPEIVKTISSCIAFAAIAGLFLLQLPGHQATSDGFAEIANAGKLIPERSRVLGISFNHNGTTGMGNTISPHYWAFLHSIDYLGAEKSLVMLSNYEAANLHFPIQFKKEINPFRPLSRIGDVESNPPEADVKRYSELTGLSVDYILTWCLSQSYQDDKEVNAFRKFLNANYELVYISKTGMAMLFRRK